MSVKLIPGHFQGCRLKHIKQELIERIICVILMMWRSAQTHLAGCVFETPAEESRKGLLEGRQCVTKTCF